MKVIKKLSIAVAGCFALPVHAQTFSGTSYDSVISLATNVTKNYNIPFRLIASLLLAVLLARTGRAASAPTYANITNYDSIIVLATNGTKNYTFTQTNGLSLVVAVRMTPFSSNSVSPAFTLLDDFGSGPSRLGIDSGLGGGDGNWVDFQEGANFSASLVSYFGIITNSVKFRIAAIGIRPNDGEATWTSSTTTNSLFFFDGETNYVLDAAGAPMAGRTYSGQLRAAQYQLSNLGAIAGHSFVLNATFVTGNGSPAVLTNPASQSVYAGDTVAFSAYAVGDPMPSVKWQVKTNGGSSFIDISGATNVNLTFTAAVTNNGSQYRALFVNTLNTTATASATLTVSLPSLSSAVVTNNQFRFSVNGAAGVNYVVQMATNLTPANWQPVATNTAPFVFTNTGSFSQQFFRAVAP